MDIDGNTMRRDVLKNMNGLISIFGILATGNGTILMKQKNGIELQMIMSGMHLHLGMLFMTMVDWKTLIIKVL